jgi:hypothetical protein
MNCTGCGPHTYVSAPGVGTAAAKHHRDMMWLLWLHRPRPHDYPTHRDGQRHRFPDGFTFRPKREPVRNRRQRIC